MNGIREQEDALYRRSLGLISGKTMGKKGSWEQLGPGRKLKKMKQVGPTPESNSNLKCILVSRLGQS